MNKMTTPWINVLIRSLPVFLLSIILIFTSVSIRADEKYYYILDMVELSEEAIVCDKYIRANASWFTAQMNELNAKYTKKLIRDVMAIVENSKFKEYDEHLRVCQYSYRYTGSINHFREAYSNLYLLLTYVEVVNEAGRFNFEFTEGLDELIINSIQGILRSKRVLNPNLRKRVPVIQDIS